jgi:hydrogenase expression/formation protein HypE
MDSVVLLDHGEGGEAMTELIRELFISRLGGPAVLEDAAILDCGGRVAMTTDSFVVRPLFFPGGDIGRLAVAGTVNDLAVMGAAPRYLSAAFILEEGLDLTTLERVVDSMAAAAMEAGVEIVTGDTKVVPRGEADGLFVNTGGIGMVPEHSNLSVAGCRPGDEILVSGPIGDHGTAVVVAREEFGVESDLCSDCQPLSDLASRLIDAAPDLRCMRDPTRGGLAAALVDLARASAVEIRIREKDIPVRGEVGAVCELLGLDPLYMACEGRLLAAVPPSSASGALAALRGHARGRNAAAIGEVRSGAPGVVLETAVGGLRPLIALRGAQLPRIC